MGDTILEAMDTPSSPARKGLPGSSSMIRSEAMHVRLDDLAAATGVGRRFLHDLEAGKPTCQLGRALAVAAAVGIHPRHLFEEDGGDEDDLPPMSN